MPDATRPPTIDPIAARRWQYAAPPHSAWLHEEVGQRMQERLQWICRTPVLWCDWQPVRGGIQAHNRVAQGYPSAQCHIVEPFARDRQTAQAHWGHKPWWHPVRWRGQTRRATISAAAPQGQADMLWANMLLHTLADPAEMIRQWHAALATDGFLMFSCLGPDTVRELHQLYVHLGWPPPGHSLTDMHDWGDMLIHAGFAEPVMDMETITLTFPTPQRLLSELRELGRNLHPARFAGLRGRTWHQQLLDALRTHLTRPATSAAAAADIASSQAAPLHLTFEIIYGHAFKPTPRIAVGGESTVSLQQMRDMLRQRPPEPPRK